jgi:hypothetical protein
VAKAEASVEELVTMIEKGQLGLPEMQRRYVWRSSRVRDLLDSLYRGYPSGIILLWETDEAIPQQEFALAQAQSPYHTARLLLDGQQRLTSLGAVIRGEPVTVRGRKRPIELLFNLDHPDQQSIVTEVHEDGHDDGDVDDVDDGADLEIEDDSIEDVEPDASADEIQRRFDQMTFVVATNKLAAQPKWIRVSEVFSTDQDAPFLSKAGIERIDDPRYTKYSQRLAKLRAIKNYVYRMDVLEPTLSYEEVTEIFVRVNSLGVKLRGSDLALAQVTAKWRNSLAIFEAFQNRIANAGFEFDLSIYLRNMIAIATGQSRFLTLGSLSKDQLESAWKLGCDGMDFAVNFTKNNLEIDSPALLSSPSLLIALSYFGHKKDYRLNSEEERELRFWALLANAKGRYSRGSSETLLDQDLATLRDGGDASALVDRLRLQVGRLDVTPDELAGRNQRSALFKTMFLAFRSAGAKDWDSKLAIALDHHGAFHRLQFHHVFPKAVLRGHYTTREADDIANLAFIAGRTNRSISAKPPVEYFPLLLERLGEEQLDLQCIPTASELRDISAYKDFLTQRRIDIAMRLNEFLGTTVS